MGLLGVSWSAVAGFLVAAVVVAYLVGRFYFRITKFQVMYFLYTKTPVGPYYHQQQLDARKQAGAAPHSQVTSHRVEFGAAGRGGYIVTMVPFLSDNWAFLLTCTETGNTAVVDPADPEAVVAAMDRARAQLGDGVTLNLTHVLTTHHHMDHAGGNSKMMAMFPGITIVGGANDGVTAATKLVRHDDEVSVGDLRIRVLDAPCHTVGHVLYYVLPAGGGGGAGDSADASGESGALFTGDTLFIGGVGKFFEGSAAQMHGNLSMIAALPPATLIFPGHEYAHGDLTFAAAVDSSNRAIADKVARVAELRAKKLPSCPSTVEDERATNVFLRCSEAGVVNGLGMAAGSDAVAVLARLRQVKDQGIASLSKTQSAGGGASGGRALRGSAAASP